MPVQEVGLEAVAAAEMGDFAGDHLQEKNERCYHIQYLPITPGYKVK